MLSQLSGTARTCAPMVRSSRLSNRASIAHGTTHALSPCIHSFVLSLIRVLMDTSSEPGRRQSAPETIIPGFSLYISSFLTHFCPQLGNWCLIPRLLSFLPELLVTPLGFVWEQGRGHSVLPSSCGLALGSFGSLVPKPQGAPRKLRRPHERSGDSQKGLVGTLPPKTAERP